MRTKTLALISTANLLAAIGGGALLGRTMGCLGAHPILRGDALLAFLGGTVLGALLLSRLPKHRSAELSAPLSLLSGILTLSLAFLLGGYPSGIPVVGWLPWA